MPDDRSSYAFWASDIKKHLKVDVTMVNFCLWTTNTDNCKVPSSFCISQTLGFVLTTPPHETPCYEIFTRRDASSGDETKQSRSKLLLHLDLRGGVFLEEAPRGRQRKRDIVLSSLRIGTGGGHLWVRWWTFGFRKMRGISWLAAEPVSFSRRTLLHGVSNSRYRRRLLSW